MAITLRVDIPRGAFSGYFSARQEDLAKAAKQAMKETGEDAKALGRANIVAAGFAANTWGQAWQLSLYPRGNRGSLAATAFLVNKIPYSGIFERGGTITPSGQRKLWIPFSSTPRIGGRKKTTPANYVASGVKLRTLKKKTRRGYPILGGTVGGQFRPLFFGIDAVSIRKRFDLIAVSERAAARFPAHFADAFASLKD